MGRRVEITGTSRADLNGKRGTAVSFDTDKGRYRVRVRGSDMYLKPSNLLPVSETGTPSSFADVKDQAEQYADEFVVYCAEIKFYGRFRLDTASTSTPSTRRLLDGVAMVPHRSTEPARPRHRARNDLVKNIIGCTDPLDFHTGRLKDALPPGLPPATRSSRSWASRCSGGQRAWCALLCCSSSRSLVLFGGAREAYSRAGGGVEAPRPAPTRPAPSRAKEVRGARPVTSKRAPDGTGLVGGAGVPVRRWQGGAADVQAAAGRLRADRGLSCADAYRRGFDDATAGRKYDADAGAEAYDDEPEGHEPSGGMGSALLSKGLPLFFFGKQVHQLGGSPVEPAGRPRNFMALDPTFQGHVWVPGPAAPRPVADLAGRSGSAQDNTGVTDVAKYKVSKGLARALLRLDGRDAADGRERARERGSGA